MTKHNSGLARLVVGLVSAAAASCVTNPPPQAPQLQTLTVKVPSFAPLVETKELQTKGGVQITVAPVSYEAAQGTRTADRDIPAGFTDRLSAPDGWQQMRFVERTTYPVVEVKPSRLAFKVHIANQLPRVFRGAGTVVQFQVAGKTVAGKPEDYGDLVNVIIPPRGQQQVEILGPSISTLEDQTTIGVFLYDVVTQTDNAGNVTEKQNFEWFFNYTPQIREASGQVAKARMWIR